MKKNPVVHFEMPAEDKKRMVEFYEKVFGWETNQLGDEMGNYVVVKTAESDEHGRPTTPGQINGGFYPKGDVGWAAHPSVVIAVDDVNEHIQKIKDAGGEVLSGPDEIPGIGLFAAFRDTEGNRVSILQPYDMPTMQKEEK